MAAARKRERRLILRGHRAGEAIVGKRRLKADPVKLGVDAARFHSPVSQRA